MQAIFPDAVDGDLLKLVCLSNCFHMIPRACSLQVGDTCCTEAGFSSVTNSDIGETVKGVVLLDGEPAIEVASAFLYCDTFCQKLHQHLQASR